LVRPNTNPTDRNLGSFNELLKKTDKDALDILKEAAKNPCETVHENAQRHRQPSCHGSIYS
jgi:hypothetical protein